MEKNQLPGAEGRIQPGPERNLSELDTTFPVFSVLFQSVKQGTYFSPHLDSQLTSLHPIMWILIPKIYPASVDQTDLISPKKKLQQVFLTSMKHSLVAALSLLCTELMFRTTLQVREEQSIFRTKNEVLGRMIECAQRPEFEHSTVGQHVYYLLPFCLLSRALVRGLANSNEPCSGAPSSETHCPACENKALGVTIYIFYQPDCWLVLNSFSTLFSWLFVEFQENREYMPYRKMSVLSHYVMK